MRQVFVRQQVAHRVRHHELVGAFAVADGVRVVFVVLDEPDDFELDRLPFVGLEDDSVLELEGTLAARTAGTIG